MTGIHRLRITTAPGESAATVVDLSQEHVWALAGGFDLGEPDIAFTADGLPVDASREVTITLHIDKKAPVGQILGDIARAVSVPDRWLMIQREPSTDPAWYRITPRSPGALDITNAYVDSKVGFWTRRLVLTVDSTAVGQSQIVPKRGSDFQSATFTNDGLERGFVLEMPGEAPAPLRVDVRPDQNINGRRPLISTFSVPWDSPLLAGDAPAIVHEDTSFTPVHAIRTTGSAFLSGGTGLTIDMAAATLRTITREGLTGWQPEPGRYLVLARIYREGSSGEALVRVGHRWGTQEAYQPWRTFRPTSGGDRSSWMPLGYLQHPLGDTGEGLDPAELNHPTIVVQAQPTVTSATAKLHFDQFAFVPVDLARGAHARATFASFENGIGYGGTVTMRVDGDRRRTAILDSNDIHHDVPQPLRTGGWPIAVPGMATCVAVFLDASDAPLGVDGINNDITMRVRAAPRLLHLGQE